MRKIIASIRNLGWNQYKIPKNIWTVSFFGAILISSFAIGCAPTAFHKPLDYASSSPKGWVIISCANPSGQTQVIRHVIQIDDHEPIELMAQSRVPVLLSEGNHRFVFSSLRSLSNSKPYPGYSVFKDNFYVYGKISEIWVHVRPGKRHNIRYTSPFWNNEQGVVKVF